MEEKFSTKEKCMMRSKNEIIQYTESIGLNSKGKKQEICNNIISYYDTNKYSESCKYTVKKLKEIAKEKNIVGYSKLNKQELCDILFSSKNEIEDKDQSENDEDLKIENNEIFKPSYYSKVSGLLSIIVLYSKEYNKNIIFLGERHDKNDFCKPTEILATDFLIDMLNSTDKPIDLFLENRWFSLKDKGSRFKDDKFRTTFTGLLGGFIDDCVISKITPCGISYRNNLRIHNIDVRFYEGLIPDDEDELFFSKVLIIYLQKIRDIIDTKIFANNSIYTTENQDEIINYNIDINDKIKIFKKINSFEETNFLNDKNKFVSKFFELIKHLKIKKQIDSIQDKKIKDKLEEMIENFKKDIEETSELLLIDNIEEVLLSRKQKNIDNLYSKILFTILNPLMDIFTISRMFRSFKKVSGKYSEEPTNIIVYTGNDHSINIIDFMSELDFDIVFMKSQGKKQCLDIKDLEIKWI